jgi:nitric oxide reductase large subunit
MRYLELIVFALTMILAGSSLVQVWNSGITTVTFPSGGVEQIPNERYDVWFTTGQLLITFGLALLVALFLKVSVTRRTKLTRKDNRTLLALAISGLIVIFSGYFWNKELSTLSLPIVSTHLDIALIFSGTLLVAVSAMVLEDRV